MDVEALDKKEDGLQVEHRTRMGLTCLLLGLYNGKSGNPLPLEDSLRKQTQLPSRLFRHSIAIKHRLPPTLDEDTFTIYPST